MKKIIALLLITAVLALLIGCKAQQKTPAVTEEDQEIAEIEQEIEEIDIEEDLDLSELDELEKDLGLI